MKFQRSRGVSVVVATLLLIAISVTAAMIVYVFVGGLAGNLTQNGGQPVTEKLLIQSYTFALSPGTCACAQQVIEIFLLNPGPAITKISAVYYDGTLLTVSTPFTTPDTALSTITNDAYTALSSTLVNDFSTAACTATAGPAASICFTNATPKTTYNVGDVGQIVITFGSPAAYGTGHTVKVVSSTGAVNVFTVVAGISG
jgi:FlaG/FlaF family flagellin (archaellin)